MDSEAALYVLLGLNVLWPVAFLLYGLASEFYDRGFDRGWVAACEAFGVAGGPPEICD